MRDRHLGTKTINRSKECLAQNSELYLLVRENWDQMEYMGLMSCLQYSNSCFGAIS